MIRIPERVPTSLGELHRDLLDVVGQLNDGAEGFILKDRAVGTSETPIAHGRRFSPTAVFVTPQADARVWKTRDPDSSAVYLAASVAVTVDIMVIP